MQLAMFTLTVAARLMDESKACLSSMDAAPEPPWMDLRRLAVQVVTL